MSGKWRYELHFLPRSVKTIWQTLAHLQKMTMTLKFNRALEVVEVHVLAKYHQAECSGSRVIVYTNVFALCHNDKKNTKIRSCDLDLLLSKSMGFVRWSRYMFMQNFIELSAAVHELLWSQRKKLGRTQYSLSLQCGQKKNTRLKEKCTGKYAN